MGSEYESLGVITYIHHEDALEAVRGVNGREFHHMDGSSIMNVSLNQPEGFCEERLRMSDRSSRHSNNNNHKNQYNRSQYDNYNDNNNHHRHDREQLSYHNRNNNSNNIHRNNHERIR